jgi:uncharacterized membrane protein YfcA
MMEWIAELVSPDIINLPLFLIVGSLSAMIVAMAKAGFGGSIGLLSVPLMVYACGGDKARFGVGLMLPILITCDYLSLIAWLPQRHQWNWKVVRDLLPATVVGIAIGGGLIYWFQHSNSANGTPEAQAIADNWLKLFIGAIALLFVTLQLIKTIQKHPIMFKPNFPAACGTGLAAGVCSTLAHAAGPITAMYLLPQGMPKERYVPTTVLFYFIANQIKLVPYFMLGLISPESLKTGLVLLPAVPVGVILGKLLANRISQNVFLVIVYTLLGLAGLHLGYGAINKLWLGG